VASVSAPFVLKTGPDHLRYEVGEFSDPVESIPEGFIIDVPILRFELVSQNQVMSEFRP
jgi:hypothetical protein